VDFATHSRLIKSAFSRSRVIGERNLRGVMARRCAAMVSRVLNPHPAGYFEALATLCSRWPV